jgi:2-polyprenyl-3-methyl-5-hydroxy-6-metoxy-1,4-benzoquinol methylase
VAPDPDAESGVSYRDALRQKLLHRSVVSGKISIPAAPGFIDDYVAMCLEIFEAIGRKFSDDDIVGLLRALSNQLTLAYESSQRSQIAITYDAPIGGLVNYHVKAEWFTVEGAYDNWVATRKPPLFGIHPDARVMALARDIGVPPAHPVLDIGAGTGRNTLPLARLGHPVDAVEMTPKFADILRAEAAKEPVSVRVIQRDVFTTLTDLRRDYSLIVLSEVVSDFRTHTQLRAMFELAAACLAGDGRLVFNVFLARDGYQPNDGERELGQQCYTTIFTRQEVAAAVAGLPLRLVSDESVYDYEKAHLPQDAWPPTSWYEEWVTGGDVYSMPRAQRPIELRWLAFDRRDVPVDRGPASIPPWR